MKLSEHEEHCDSGLCKQGEMWEWPRLHRERKLVLIPFSVAMPEPVHKVYSSGDNGLRQNKFFVSVFRCFFKSIFYFPVSPVL